MSSIRTSNFCAYPKTLRSGSKIFYFYKNINQLNRVAIECLEIFRERDSVRTKNVVGKLVTLMEE